MSDIIDRLQFDATRCAAQYSWGVASNIEAAAAEITRLRAENEKLTELLRGTGANRYWEARWRDERAENEKLRAALKDLLSCTEYWLKQARPDWDGSAARESAIGVARAWLTTEERP